MENTRIIAALKAVLSKEIELLGKIPPLQSLLRDAVSNREWADYEMLMESVGRVGGDFVRRVAERAALGGELGGEGETFYAVSARLPEKERAELGSLYRRLKMETLQIRLSNDTLMDYLKETKAAISAALENACPERKGKIYSRSGAEKEAELKSVVLNRTF
jgi:hypothetical protein